MKVLFALSAVLGLVLGLSGCAQKPEPYTIQACIDGTQVAEFRDACLGQRPAEGMQPTEGQYDSDRCSTLQLRVGQFCESPAAEPAEVVVNP